MKRKAYGGDGEAIFRLAETYGSRTNPTGNYLTYMRAVDCLPSGPLRTKAINKARAVYDAMPPEDQKQAGPLLENFRNDARRLGVGCRR